MRLWHSGAVMAITAALAVTPEARADTTIYYHAGSWDAFEATATGGQPICGIGSHNLADGSSLSMRFQLGGSNVTFTASKPGWQIPDGTTLPVVMQVGLSEPWTEQAIGNGDRVEWTLDTDAMQTFDTQFRAASSMTLTFPGGTEPPWVIGLRGSTAISNAMGRCISDLRQRANTTVPPQSATQPFGAAPAASSAPAAPAAPAVLPAPTAPAAAPPVPAVPRRSGG